MQEDWVFNQSERSEFRLVVLQVEVSLWCLLDHRMKSGHRYVSDANVNIMASPNFSLLCLGHVDNMYHLPDSIGYALQHHVVRLLGLLVHRLTVLDDMQRNVIASLGPDEVRETRFAKLAFEVLPVVCCCALRLLCDHATIQPFLEALKMNVLHRAGTLAGREEGITGGVVAFLGEANPAHGNAAARTSF